MPTMSPRCSLFVATAVALLAVFGQVEGFASVFHTTGVTAGTSTALSAHSSRRSFAVATMGAAFATLTSIAPGSALDDLAMPSADSSEAQQKAEMEARLARKAELKAAKAAPKTYQESIQKELAKKKADGNISQTDRRNAMCEELGRGC